MKTYYTLYTMIEGEIGVFATYVGFSVRAKNESEVQTLLQSTGHAHYKIGGIYKENLSELELVQCLN